VTKATANGIPPLRLRALPSREVLGALYPVAVTRRARLLGLALLDRDDAGPGLLLPGCRSIHTFGMRFALDVWFLGPYGEPLEVRRALGARRVARHREARSVLEVPA
jgi:uncharacterized protein